MYRHFFKRFFDILLSFLALVILSPIFLIVAILVKANLGGKIIFKQARPGKNGKLFMIYKFRTMKNTRGEDGNLLPDEIRRTKFGDALRKTSLDELPQLWNILKGDMSIVGPRPQDIWNVMYYDENVKSFTVRPGLTGKSQAYGRNDNSWEQMFRMDVEYCEKITFWRDVKILFKTVGVILSPSKAERTQYKWYPEKLLAEGKISQDDFEQGFVLARKIEREFTQTRKGSLVNYVPGQKAEYSEKKYYSKEAV